MATAQQISVLVHFRDAARVAGHLWPEYAACEGVLESTWGTSKLFTLANNVFGQKQGSTTAEYPSLSLPTREYVRGAFITVPANWVKFPTVAESFEARMSLLFAASKKYAEYAAAIAAPSGEEFVRNVSKKWSTDPLRADHVLAIYNAHKDVLLQKSPTGIPSND